MLRFVRPGSGFEPNFELTEKVKVNGEDEHPLFTFLKVGQCVKLVAAVMERRYTLRVR